MRKLSAYTLFLGAAYFGTAYWPVGRKYFAIRYVAQELAQKRIAPGEQLEPILQFLRQVEQETGVVLYRGDVSYESNENSTVVTVHATIPVQFSFIDRVHPHRFTIRASPAKIYGGRQ